MQPATIDLPPMPVLVVQDNPHLSSALAAGLREDGYQVEVVATGGAALRRLERKDIDVVVLDLGLPDMDGLSVVSGARDRGIHVPILILTARDNVGDRVRAFDSGADDFIGKPYVYAELLARLRALMRRAAGPRWAPRGCNGLVFRDDDLGVSIGGENVVLSPREHALLGFFLRRNGEAISRREIMKQVFGYDFETGTNLVNVHIAHLRSKIGVRAVVIETVRGFGYRLRAALPGDAGAG